ncbi:MAG: type II toxin-antitoxin system HicA family toxin [Cyanobacteriota bacterium]|nr:type II toxin-antitoxin system HicA family toxin [Cyanobacteriota bacterium]
MKTTKQLKKLARNSKNVKFNELVNLIQKFGFALERVSGSHHIFKHPEVTEILNLQPRKGKAKDYQVKQFGRLVEKYELQPQID